MTTRTTALVAGVAIFLSTGLGASWTLAGPTETALLQQYVASWKGSARITGPEAPQTMSCSLVVAKGNGGKINFRGKCSALEVAGTIAFVDNSGRYEAALTSNVDFAGVAVGRTSGSDLVFALQDRQQDEKGNDLALRADMILREGAIGINFDAVLNGQPHKGSVVFTK